MTNTVTLNGNTYNDGITPPGNMGNGGHRSNLLPMLSDAVIDFAAKQTAAGASATAAAASAASAVLAPGSNGTSTTTLTIAVGTQSLTIQAGKNFVVGMQCIIANTASPNNWMAGPITAYNSGTGALSVNVTNYSGSASGVSTWTVSAAGAPGVTGLLKEIHGTSIASAATINLSGANGNFIHITGNTGPITTITVADGWEFTLIFDSNPQLTASASLLIPGVPSGASYSAQAGDRVIVRGDTSGANIVSWTRAIDIGMGGSTSGSGNVTLTSGSAGAQAIATTAYGQYVTMPDATTCILGNNVFSLLAAGDFPLGIKDAAGNQLGWIPPHKSVIAGLAGQANAAGVWTLPGVSKVAVTASFNSSGVTSLNPFLATRIVIDSTHTLFLFGSSVAGNPLYAVIYDSGNQAWGAIATVATAACTYTGMLSGANQVIVVYANATTAVKALTLSTSGTTITVNGSPASVTAGGVVAAATTMSIVACGSSFIVVYSRATNSAGAIAMTISGTTVTAGSELVVSTTAGANIALFGVSSTVALLIYADSGSAQIDIKPISVSAGTTLSNGTLAVMAAGSTSASFVCGIVGSNWYLIPANGGGMSGGVISVSGSVASVSTCTLSATGLVWGNFDVAVVGNKVLTVGGVAASSTTLRANIMTNTSGTASAGTEQSITGFGAIVLTTVVNVSGNSCRAVMQNSLSEFLIGADVSGSSPVLTIVDAMQGGATIPTSNVNSYNGMRSSSIISNGTSWYGFTQTGSTPATSPVGNANQICTMNLAAANDPGMSIKYAPAIPGANANETWAVAANIGTNTGVSIQRIECAA